MSGVRRALVLTTAERYYSLVANFTMMVVVSRLLTPAEIGVWAVATAISAIALSIREFAASTYLIQLPVLTREDVQGGFAVMLLTSTLISVALALASSPLATLYNEAELAPYLRVAAIGIFLELTAAPLAALMRRDMQFTRLLIINMASVSVSVGVTLSLATLGFSYMSFAWAWVASSVVGGILAICLRPDFWVFRPLFRHWRGMVAFGGYNGLSLLLARLYEAVPYTMLGRIWSFDAAGLYNRAAFICQMPDKVFFGGLASVILPALSAEIRAGRSLKQPFLTGIAYITGFQWPAMIVLALLAHPIVHTVLGDQWLEVVPVVQIMALATLLSLASELNSPVLISHGAMRDLLVRGLITWPTSGIVIAIASFFGLKAVAVSFLLVTPFQTYVAFHFVRRHIALQWTDLLAACHKSMIVALFAGAGPAAVLLASGATFAIPVPLALLALLLAAIGWTLGLWLTQHPLLAEIRLGAVALRRLVAPGSPENT